ncbi:MAG: hypothetical protein E3J65_04140 [Dehalococcoidia bacterium]|nr:MAG: hypothetical protein E3J65_04140 [Dehalococcoidia bacterium]
MDEERRVVWFEDVGKEDISLVGAKGANLGEMTKAHIPVPPGFILTAQSYFYFFEKSNLSGEIRTLVSSLDPNDSGELQRVASKIKEAINSSPMPKEIAQEIGEAYRKMGAGLVAVRSSATTDYPELTEKLVEWGITSVSVIPDDIERTRELIARVEGRLARPSLWRRS